MVRRPVNTSVDVTIGSTPMALTGGGTVPTFRIRFQEQKVVHLC